MLKRKHINQTTIALEPLFWTTIKDIAEPYSIQQWVTENLANKPDDTGAASWLRQQTVINLSSRV